MATISSAGIGSGLDVNSIVSQLVALEKQPLKSLALKATTTQAQISAFGDIQSQFAALTDVASRISVASTWGARNGTSSNISAATITATGTANATSFSLDVDQLAKKQSISSVQIASGGFVGAGTLNFSLGTWTGLAASTANDAVQANIDAAATATAAGVTAMSQTSAVKTALASFAIATPAAAAFSTAYGAWADSAAANDHVTPALQAAEDAALAARDSAEADLGVADPAAQTAARSLAATATAAVGLAAFAVGTPATSDYSSKYTAWVDAVAANDHVTPALMTAESDALGARDTAYAALGGADQTSVDGITSAATYTTATTSVANWKSAADASFALSTPRASFGVPSSTFSIDVTATDTVATLAAKINAANGGVVATAFNDGGFDRLLLSSKETGAASGFRVQASGSGDSTNFDNTGLSRLAYDPQTGAFGMASVGVPVQEGGDAVAHINGLKVTSASNTLASNIPGVTIKLLATTTTSYNPVTDAGTKSPLTMTISEDVTPAVKNVSDFVTAYNNLNKTLSGLTKYVAATKTAGLFQGDASVVGLQNVLRSMLGSSSLGASSQYLSDVGLQRQLDGSLTIDTDKLSLAANNGTTLQQLFTSNNGDPMTNGFALKFKALGQGVAASGGSVATKATALQSALDRNTQEQAKVNNRAALFETRVRKQYSALDAQMAQLNALNSYVAQQVTLWNRSTS